jgi:exosortase N
MPDTFIHNAAGIAGLGLYVFLPLYFLIHFLAKKYAHKVQQNAIPLWTKLSNIASTEQRSAALSENIFQGIMILSLVYISFFSINDKKTYTPSTQLTIKTLEDNNCPKKIVKDGILSYQNADILVYIKPIIGFYAAEHSPLICWQGSGYTFGQVNTATIKNVEIYRGVLKNNQDTLQTAWWYDNGMTRTTSQTVWRAALLKGEKDFNLVNVTSADSAILHKHLEMILAEQ